MSSQSGELAPYSFSPIAHRGGAFLPSNIGIENTLAAFRNATRLGFRHLETDVHVTKDGELVVFHDSDLARIAGVPAQISDLTLEELKQIRIGGKEEIPTLDELFEAFPSAYFNIDIKTPRAVVALAETIRSHGLENQVCVASFSTCRLLRFRKLLPGVTTAISPLGVMGMLVERVAKHDPGSPRVYQVPLFHKICGIPVRIVTPARVQAVQRAGHQIQVWTVDDALQMHQLIDWRVDGIMTDRPDVLKQVLRERGMWSTRFGV